MHRGGRSNEYAPQQQQKLSGYSFETKPLLIAAEHSRTCMLRSSGGRVAITQLAWSRMDRAVAVAKVPPAGALPPRPPPPSPPPLPPPPSRTSASLAVFVKTAATWISFSLGSCCSTMRCRSARLLQEAMSTVSCLGCSAPIGREAVWGERGGGGAEPVTEALDEDDDDDVLMAVRPWAWLLYG